MVHVRVDTHPEIWTWSCMVMISSSLRCGDDPIGCLSNRMRSSRWCRKPRLRLGYDNEASSAEPLCDVQRPRTDVGELTRDTQSWQWQSLGLQAAPSRVHHLTTRNWSLTGSKPTTACQQDSHIWQQNDRHRTRLQGMQPCSWDSNPCCHHTSETDRTIPSGPKDS